MVTDYRIVKIRAAWSPKIVLRQARRLRFDRLSDRGSTGSAIGEAWYAPAWFHPDGSLKWNDLVSTTPKSSYSILADSSNGPGASTGRICIVKTRSKSIFSMIKILATSRPSASVRVAIRLGGFVKGVRRRCTRTLLLSPQGSTCKSTKRTRAGGTASSGGCKGLKRGTGGSTDPARFHIKALFHSFAHRECFPR